MKLVIGDMIPVFSLQDQEGKLFHMSDVLGKKSVVIFFYPKDFTPGCTKEVCSFRDAYDEFVEVGAEVIGISGDSTKSHRDFSGKHKLPFTLLSDPGGRVKQLFGVSNDWLFIPGRETFVADDTGRLLLHFDSMDATTHIEKALNALKK